MHTLRLLHIDDNEDDSVLLRHHLGRAGYSLKWARVETAEQMRAELDRHPWNLVLSDYAMPHFSALEAIAILRERRLEIPFIMVSGAMDEEVAAAVMRAGAHDYVMKGNLTRLGPAIQRELTGAASRRERARAQEALRNAEKLATLGRLAASIAHEINNPLEAITNVLYLLQRHPGVSDEARQFVDLAEKEAERVGQLVRQALGFSRRRHDGVSQTSVRELVQSVLDLYAPKIQASKVSISAQFGIDGQIHAVSDELQQVFSNLILNAVDAVGETGLVKIRVSAARDWRDPERQGVRVVIADSGVGIRPEHREEIFEPFFSTKGEKGTGLGLWICSEIIERHGGTIRMRSSVNSHRIGTTFSVFLPVATKTQPAAKSQPA